MFAGYVDSYGGPARRGVFGLAIVAAHVGFVALLAWSAFDKPEQEKAPPIEVSFMEQPSAERELPVLSDPKLAVVQPVSVTLPDVPITSESEATTIVAETTEAPPSSSPATPVSQPVAVAEPPSMSRIAYLKQPEPRYPSESRRAFEEGLVILRVLIDESGHAKTIHVYRSSGHPRLDDAARDAVERAVFRPYMDGGTPREAVAMVPVEFSLHRG
jgi:protein TonB